MRYLLVDHITEITDGRLIRGIKNVAMTEDFLEFHFPSNPIMPGVMLLEALTQLAGWLVASSSGFEKWLAVRRVNKSQFYSFALPGDQIELEVELEREGDAGHPRFRGTGTVAGRKKIVAEFEGETVPLQDLEDPEEQKRFFKILTRNLKL
jgi:3-hydroxyacyl-[acyl-carrier-protein] dehydratase